MFPASRRNDHVMKLELWRRNEGCLGRLLSQVLFGRSAAFEVPTSLNRDSASAVAPVALGRGRAAESQLRFRPAEGFWQGRRAGADTKEKAFLRCAMMCPCALTQGAEMEAPDAEAAAEDIWSPLRPLLLSLLLGLSAGLAGAPARAADLECGAELSLSETQRAPPLFPPFPHPCATRPGMARVSSWQIASAPGQRPMPRKPRTDCECLQERLPQVQRVTQAATMPCSLTRS